MLMDPKRVSLILALLAGAAGWLQAPVAAAPAPWISLDDDEEAEDDAEKKDDGPKWTAVVGGDVYVGVGGVLRGATVLSKDGVIEEVGFDIFVPEEAEVLDVTGYRVYPGLVAISSSGLFGSSGGLEDSMDPYSRNLVLALASGLTTAANGSEVGKLKFGEIEDLVVGSNFFQSLSFGNSNPAGKRSLRAKLKEASAYIRDHRVWKVKVKSDKELKEPKTSGLDTNLIAVLRGEKRALFSANDSYDLQGIARLAQTYGFRPVIKGCREGWVVADELGRAGAMAIITARSRGAKDERQTNAGGASIENAAKLYAAGVQIAIVPATTGITSLGGIVGRDIIHLPTEAAFAVRGGLPEQAALESMTIIPARMMGVDHRIGSIEVGKDADLIITDGDVLHYETFVQWALVEGKVVYDKQAELYYAHIRPRPETEVAPAEKVDVGESEDEVELPPEEDGAGEGEKKEEEAGDGGE